MQGRFYQTVFATKLGPMGVVRSERGLVAVRVGFGDAGELRLALERQFPDAEKAPADAVAKRLMQYAAGAAISFADIELDEESRGLFSLRVANVCRKIPAGQTISYGELARRAGFPAAARAAGQVMAKNPWPIIVPCHRVVTSAGRLGGYSAPQGLDFKRRLLELEARTRRN